jgi:glycosyltransferase involved in cell wall biosynthesis
MIVAVMPAYNEEKTVFNAVKETKRYVNKVVVIDDASRDNTATLAKKAGATVIRHEQNMGLGSALRTGFRKALDMNADIVLTIDADGQHNPRDIEKFVKAVESGYDFVLGKRNLRRYPFMKKVGNLFLNNATNFIAGTNLRDTESGFRAIRGSALKKFYLKGKRYEIAVEIIFEVGRNNLKATNVEIDSPVYVKGVGIFDGFSNFMFLMHRRERTWRSYITDVRYVLKRWLN